MSLKRSRIKDLNKTKICPFVIDNNIIYSTATDVHVIMSFISIKQSVHLINSEVSTKYRQQIKLIHYISIQKVNNHDQPPLLAN